MLSNYSLKINDKDRRSDELAKPIFDALDGGWSRDWISIHPLLSLIKHLYPLSASIYHSSIAPRS